MISERIEIRLPEFGKKGEKINFLNWIKKVGDIVCDGDELFEVETDKATVVFEAEQSGVVAEFLVESGEVNEGDLLGFIDAR